VTILLDPLLCVVLMPLLSALGLIVFPRREGGLLRMAALILFLLQALGCLFLVMSDLPSGGYTTDLQWIPSLALNVQLRYDGASGGVIMLIAGVFPAALCLEGRVLEARRSFTALFMLQAAMLLVCLSDSLLLFIVSWQLMVLGTSVYLGPLLRWRYGLPALAASGLMMLAGLELLVAYHDGAGAVWASSFDELHKVLLPRDAAWRGALLLLPAILMQFCMVPLHGWVGRSLELGSTPFALVAVAMGPAMGGLLLSRWILPQYGLVWAPFTAELSGGVAIVAVVAAMMVSAERSGVRLIASICLVYGAIALTGFLVVDADALASVRVLLVAYGIGIAGLVLGFESLARAGFSDLKSLRGLRSAAPGFYWRLVLVTLCLVAFPLTMGFGPLMGLIVALIGVAPAAAILLSLSSAWVGFSVCRIVLRMGQGRPRAALLEFGNRCSRRSRWPERAMLCAIVCSLGAGGSGTGIARSMQGHAEEDVGLVHRSVCRSAKIAPVRPLVLRSVAGCEPRSLELVPQ